MHRTRWVSVVALAGVVLFAHAVVEAQHNPSGFIQVTAWNFLFPLGNPLGAAPGTAAMKENWIPPSVIGDPAFNPRHGAAHGTTPGFPAIDFAASPSSGFTVTPLAAAPTWFTAAGLEVALAPFGVPAGTLTAPDGWFNDQGGQRINFQRLVDRFAAAPPAGLGIALSGDNVLALATTYIENTSGGPLLIEFCGASDDSLQVWLNQKCVINHSEPRGSGGPGTCQNRARAILAPGVSKLAVLVWEGGGGHDFRLGIENGFGVQYIDGGPIVFRGPGAPGDGLTGQPQYCITRSGSATVDPLNCPLPERHVTLTGNGVGDPGALVTVCENLRGDASAIEVGDVSHGGVVSGLAEDPTPPGLTPTTVASFDTSSLVGMDEGGLSATVHEGGGVYANTSSTGNDIWAGCDDFQFDYNAAPLAGDFDVSLEFLSRTHATGLGRWGKFGLMARESLDRGSRYTMIQDHLPDLQDSTRVAGRRVHLDCGTTFEVGGPIAHPRFMRLTRRGNTVTGWVSDHAGLADGSLDPRRDCNWIGVHGEDWGGAPSVLVGFANSEHDSDGSVAQTIRYRLLPDSAGGCVLLGKKITWTDVTRGEVEDGLSYSLAHSGRAGTVTFGGSAALGTALTEGVASIAFAEQTGVAGVFDDSHDIGGPPSAGSTEVSGNPGDPGGLCYTIRASGADIWDGGDQFRFIYQRVSGDFVATARIKERINPPSAGRWGKHGIMARYSCDGNSKYSMVQANLATNPAEIDTPRYAFRQNHLTNGTNNDSYQIDDGVFPNEGRLPTWMRLVRKGDVIYGYFAESDPDDAWSPGAWCFAGSDWAPGRPETLLVGMAITAHTGNAVQGGIRFDHWSCVGPETPAELQGAFAFGSRNLSCPTASDPSTSFTMVHHSGNSQAAHDALRYDAGRGWGFEVIDPGNTGRNGGLQFGPFDESPNGRNRFADTCPEQLYDSFIGFKSYTRTCDAAVVGDGDTPCGEVIPVEGGIFRIDVPNGLYRFVGAFGEADNNHASRILAEDGGSGPPAMIGPNHVVLVSNHDQAQYGIGEARADRPGAGVFARVGFDDKLPPVGDGAGADPVFVDMDRNGRPTVGPADSPILEVTQGYVRIHLVQGNSNNGPGGTRDPNGSDIVLLEAWRLEDGAPPELVCLPGATHVDTLDFSDPGQLGEPVTRGGGFLPAVVDGRLRITEDGVGGQANAVWYGVPAAGSPSVPLLADGFVAEFDAFLSKGAGGCDRGGDPNPADGMTFAVIATSRTDGLASAIGPFAPGLEVETLGGDGGGALGYAGGTIKQRADCHPSFAIEIDNWVGGGNNEPVDGGSPNSDCNWHVGVDVNGDVTSLQTNVDHGVPTTALPDIYAAAGVHFEVFYFADGQIDVWATANDGSVGRTQVLSYCIDALPVGDVVFGFTGGTGGATTRQEVDNLEISSICCELPDAVTIDGPPSFDNEMTAVLAASFSGADADVTYAWSIVSGPGEVAGASDGSSVEIRCTGLGDVVVRVDASDGTCNEPASATHTVTCICPEEGDTHSLGLVVAPSEGAPGTFVATADASDDSGDAIIYTFEATDGVATLSVGPQASNTASFDLTDGSWTITVTVDDDANCPDAAADDSGEASVFVGGRQLPGDCNQDSELDLSDAACVLNVLFVPLPPNEFPCGDGLPATASNVRLLDVNDDANIDLADVIYVLNYLFQGGPQPAQGIGCIRIAGCPDDASCP